MQKGPLWLHIRQSTWWRASLLQKFRGERCQGERRLVSSGRSDFVQVGHGQVTPLASPDRASSSLPALAPLPCRSCYSYDGGPGGYWCNVGGTFTSFKCYSSRTYLSCGGSLSTAGVCTINADKVYSCPNGWSKSGTTCTRSYTASSTSCSHTPSRTSSRTPTSSHRHWHGHELGVALLLGHALTQRQPHGHGLRQQHGDPDWDWQHHCQRIADVLVNAQRNAQRDRDGERLAERHAHAQRDALQHRHGQRIPHGRRLA